MRAHIPCRLDFELIAMSTSSGINVTVCTISANRRPLLGNSADPLTVFVLQGPSEEKEPHLRPALFYLSKLKEAFTPVTAIETVPGF